MSVGATHLFVAGSRAVRRMIGQQFTGAAAELAYYGFLSAVPCFAVFVGVLGLIGAEPETTNAIARIVRDAGSREAGEAARDAAESVIGRDSAAGVALGAGTLTTLWVASTYLAAFRRTAHRVYGVDAGAGWRARPLQIVLTFVGIVVLALAALALAATGRIFRGVGRAVGAEDATVTISSIARWPLMLAVLLVMTAALYTLAPRDSRAGRGILSAGSVAAVLAWMLASLGFAVWMGAFATYDATYGALAGAVAFAIWLWVSNLALLFGLVLDLELELDARERVPLERGVPQADPPAITGRGARRAGRSH